ncbi:hypothetical protein I5L01_05090 [Erythrobacter sp. YJ-T3-07]|uniref:hypothetical protein n=1 Tax=Erythrobacter sp. YJ-T3-07 TaxID=2793063 RepID=UPI0018D463E0|nr:hypothetical protein [Erythrobacter sp. YJ-T3-07]MBH1943606.1 hypothetical protein [Erythrobacter sp. YJ-T3-07]
MISVLWYLAGAPNSFGKDGLIDGLGGITTVLAGFFVAGLVAIATFFRENSSLDDIIERGPAIIGFGTDDQESLTRRQYVCSMFGFLVGLSFFLAISAVFLRSFATSISLLLVPELLDLVPQVGWSAVLEISGVFIWILLFSWQIIVTLRGLYYLMDRIYDVRPTLGRKPRERDEGPNVTPL